MNLKRVIGTLAGIIVVVMFVTAILGGPENIGTNDDDIETPGTPDDPGSETPGEPTEPEEPDEPGEDDIEDKDNEAQPTTEDEGCIEILPGISRDYEIIRLNRELGEPITLDASEIFGVSAEMYAWTQVFAEMEDLQYMSNHELSITYADGDQATVNATYPGVYRIELEADGLIYEMELKATKVGKEIAVKGINFIDLFGATGGPEFNIHPDDPECFQLALDHAFEGPERAGVEWIGMVSGGFYNQVDPPVMQDDDTFLSNSDEAFHEEFVEAAHSRDMKVIETFQDGPSVFFTPEQYEELSEARMTPEWWDNWYEEWKTFLLKRAEMSERHGVDAIILLMFSEGSMDQTLVPDSAEKWTDIINSVREVYSGEIGLNFISLDERFTFIEELDFIQVTYFGGLWTSRGMMVNVQEPTIDEVMAINDIMFEGMELYDSKGVPVYILLTVGSSDGQNQEEDPALRSGVDFNEQVLYYEAFYTSLDQYDWVDGIFTERWDFWDEYRRFGEDYNVQYFSEIGSASPRNKPAEDVVALWHEVYQSP